MPEAFSIAGLLIGYAALNAFGRAGSAVSPEAQAISKAATEVIDSFERSQVLFGEKSAAISQLKGLANECADSGWDGEDARAIDELAVSTAERFLRALPQGVALPEFAPEPDGSISLDWIQSRKRLFSLSVGNSNRLAFTWLDGTDKGHGVARFDGENIPLRILEGINAIMNHQNASLWVA
jgi:hypothetical protein